MMLHHVTTFINQPLSLSKYTTITIHFCGGDL